MTVKKAIILAAGMSSRLKELSNALPKALIKLDEKQTLLERNLKLMIEEGYQEFVVVLGYNYERALEKCRQIWQNIISNRAWLSAKQIETSRLKISYVNNEDYQAKDNIYSVALIADQLGRNTMLFNSDLVFDSQILSEATRQLENNHNSFMIVDNHKTLVDEDMKIILKEDNLSIARISKSLDNSGSFGEYIGMLRLNQQDSEIYARKLNELMKAQEFKRHYEFALDQILDDIRLEFVSTSKKIWKEIDTPADLKDAKNLFCEDLASFERKQETV